MYRVSKIFTIDTCIDGNSYPYRWKFEIEVEFTDMDNEELDSLANIVSCVTNELNGKKPTETEISITLDSLVRYISDSIKETQNGNVAEISCRVRHGFWTDDNNDVVEYSTVWDEFSKRWV